MSGQTIVCWQKNTTICAECFLLIVNSVNQGVASYFIHPLFMQGDMINVSLKRIIFLYGMQH